METLQDKLNIVDIHDGLKYSIIQRRLDRINKDRVKKIKFIHEFKGIYVYNVNDKAYILFTRYKDKGELVWLLNHIIGMKE